METYPYPHPSAAAYPPPVFTGGHYTSPFPFYSAPPAVPYAASYPYPPPASAYAHPPGFFPTPAYPYAASYPQPPYLWPAPSTPSCTSFPFGSFPADGPSTFPSAATYSQTHMLPTELAAPPTPEPLTTGTPDSSTTPATALRRGPDQDPGAPLSTDLCSPTPWLLEAIPTAERCKSQSHASSTSSGPTTTPSSPSASLFPFKADQVRSFLAYDGNDPASPTTAIKRQPDRAPVAITDLAPMFKLHDRETDAIQRHATAASTPGLFSGATTSPTPSYSPTTTAPTPLSCFTTSAGSSTTASTTSSLFSSATSMFPVSASTAPSATAYAAPQVFDEMPTPVSWQETHGTASDHCSGHHNPVQSTCESNLSEQNRNGMPQAYGLHNLNRQSVFRADGTEHHYYVLPKTYPLARATPQPVFDVCDEETKDCLNEFGDVFTSSLEQPAISFHKAPESASIEQLVKCLSKAPENEQTSKYMRQAFENERHSAYSTVSATATDLLQFQAFERLPMFDVDDDKTDGCSSVFVDVFASTPEQQIHDEEQHESEQRHKYSSEHSKNPLPQVVAGLTLPDNAEADVSRYIKFTHGQCIQKIVKSDLGHGYAMGDVPHLKTYKLNMLLSDEGREVWDPGASTPLHSSKPKPREELSYVAIGISKVLHLCNQFGTYGQQLRDSSWNVLVVLEKRKAWDPGEHTILSSTLNKDIVGALQTSILNASGTFTLPYVLPVRITLCASKCCDPQQCYYRVPSRLIIHGNQFLWDPGILTQMDMMLGKTAVPNLVHSGLHINMSKLVDCSAIHACYLVSALLPPTQFVAKGSYNIEVGELNSRCLVFHLNLITKCTSTASNDITSSEYAYTMDFNRDQWEFVHQHGIQQNYNAKNLLSSPNYLQILEMDIIFTRFLPP